MTERSARFALPFMQPGQAQKEAYHNEALAALDGLVHASVKGAAAAPPAEPADGECWIVAAGAGGAWAGEEGRIALRTAGGWRFLVPVPGMSLWDEAAGIERRWSGTEWSGGEVAAAALVIDGEQVVGPRLAEIAGPAGGAVIDTEARAVLDAVIVTLKSHGLID